MQPSDWQALKRLLTEKREALLPEPPKCFRKRRQTDEDINALSAWYEKCEMVDELLEQFQDWEPNT